ncbi:hypothetical protein ACOME3_010508 [Neoechinorhynchus agilis]
MRTIDLNVKTSCIPKVFELGYEMVGVSVDLHLTDAFNRKKSKKSTGRLEIPDLMIEKDKRILKRLNVFFKNNQHVDELRNPLIRQRFDIVSIVPVGLDVLKYFASDQTAFRPDIICLDTATTDYFPVPVRIIKAAVDRGTTFELNYASSINDELALKAFVRHLKAYSAALNGKNLIISSGSVNWNTIRTPGDVENLIELFAECPMDTEQSIERVLKWSFTRKSTQGQGQVFVPLNQ